MTYRPRSMPARFMHDAPAIVRKSVLDIIAIKPAAPLDYDVIFRHEDCGPHDDPAYGIDFSKGGLHGCHFFLQPHDMRAYRERNRRKRVAWADLPAATQSAIIRYLES